MIRHHADPKASKSKWTPEVANLPSATWLEPTDFTIQSDTREMARQTRAVDIAPIPLSDQEIADIEAFLNSLTGASGNSRPMGRPSQVPSGLSVD
jgi:cytochrome c peroxidase